MGSVMAYLNSSKQLPKVSEENGYRSRLWIDCKFGVLLLT
jgi:hypothetical protein